MKLEVKYLFQSSFSVKNFYIYQLAEGLGMRKILANGTRNAKGSKNQEGGFLNFNGFLRNYAGPMSNLDSSMEISSMASLTPISCITKRK